MRVHSSIVLLTFASAIVGCRTVWIHENWEQGLYEKDYSECRAEAAESRRVTRVNTRKCTVDSETGDQICIEEETRGRTGPKLNWKMCMFARGWETRADFRSSSISRPKGRSSPTSKPGRG